MPSSSSLLYFDMAQNWSVTEVITPADVSLVAVIATASLASLSQVVLTAGSGNVLMSTAVFQACGLNPHLAATAGLLSAITSIWLSVPVALAAMFADRRLHPSKVKGAEGAKKE